MEHMAFYREYDITLSVQVRYHHPTATTDLVDLIRLIYLMLFNQPAPNYRGVSELIAPRKYHLAGSIRVVRIV
jgi:hypothetical protein